MDKKNILDYCIFIITYRRPNKQHTLKYLRKTGVTRKIFLVVSEDDPTLPQYREIYKEMVVTYRREDYQPMLVDNRFNDRLGTIVYVRNAVYDLAEKLGYEFFIVLDDDYIDFLAITPNDMHKYVQNPQEVFDILFEFYQEQERVKLLAVMQRGDFVGGVSSLETSAMRVRKVMNVFFCSTKRRVQFIGRINEDICTYVKYGNRGDIFLSVPIIFVSQLVTQSQKGGLTETYYELGTYNKSIRVVLIQPSSVKIGKLGTLHPRLHTKINWNKTVPKIVSSRYL